eukprot:scaffold19419_cov64-Phaeocystis_antarctica.AAC.4
MLANLRLPGQHVPGVYAVAAPVPGAYAITRARLGFHFIDLLLLLLKHQAPALRIVARPSSHGSQQLPHVVQGREGRFGRHPSFSLPHSDGGERGQPTRAKEARAHSLQPLVLHRRAHRLQPRVETRAHAPWSLLIHRCARDHAARRGGAPLLDRFPPARQPPHRHRCPKPAPLLARHALLLLACQLALFTYQLPLYDRRAVGLHQRPDLSDTRPREQRTGTAPGVGWARRWRRVEACGRRWQGWRRRGRRRWRRGGRWRCVSSHSCTPGSLPPPRLVPTDAPPHSPDAELAAAGLLRGSFGPPALATREALRAKGQGQG